MLMLHYALLSNIICSTRSTLEMAVSEKFSILTSKLSLSGVEMNASSAAGKNIMDREK